MIVDTSSVKFHLFEVTVKGEDFEINSTQPKGTQSFECNAPDENVDIVAWDINKKGQRTGNNVVLKTKSRKPKSDPALVEKQLAELKADLSSIPELKLTLDLVAENERSTDEGLEARKADGGDESGKTDVHTGPGDSDAGATVEAEGSVPAGDHAPSAGASAPSPERSNDLDRKHGSHLKRSK